MYTYLLELGVLKHNYLHAAPALQAKSHPARPAYKLYFLSDQIVPASGAEEALLVVGVSERCDHLALDVLAADGALCTVPALVVLRTKVLAILGEEPALCQ